jgi:cation:H+ antiporter
LFCSKLRKKEDDSDDTGNYHDARKTLHEVHYNIGSDTLQRVTGSITAFIVGILVLLYSTEIFIRMAVRISSRLRISPLIIGTTVVAVGTSIPELAVSGIAAANNDPGLAIGNIIGSNIVNITLVLPVGILIGKLRIGTTKTQKNALLLLAVTALFTLSQIPAFARLSSGILFLALALIITIGEYRWGVIGRDHEDAVRFHNRKHHHPPSVSATLLALSLAGIVIGGYITVTSVEAIARLTGYSTTVLGLSLTAVVTSIPELLATIVSQEEHQAKITIGNVIGSNIYNLLLIGGITLLIARPQSIPALEWIFLLATTGAFFAIIKIFSGKVIPRWVGIGLLGLFAIFLLTLRQSAI